jgi:Tfp pilus assembly protein PilF
VQAIRKALQQDPNYKEVHFQLHESYARLGNKAESQEHLQIFERLTREDRNRAQEELEQQKR